MLAPYCSVSYTILPVLFHTVRGSRDLAETELDFVHLPRGQSNLLGNPLACSLHPARRARRALPITFTHASGGCAPVFSRPVWPHGPVLLPGAGLAPGKRPVTAM